MDAFEEIVAGLFRRLGYWTWQSYKIDLEVADKWDIGKHSMPRPEIDILAYSPGKNELLWIECKSYLDSPGVKIGADKINPEKMLIGIRVFDDDKFRKIASQKLILQTISKGLTCDNPDVKFCLVAGNIHGTTEKVLRQYFEKNTSNGWELYDRDWIIDKLGKLADLSYENDIATIVAKLFKRTKEKTKDAD